MKKTCTSCGVEKDITDFYLHKKSGRINPCKKCCNKRGQQWAEENRPRHREMNHKANIKHFYGMSVEEYDALYNRQHGCCAICGRHQSNLKRRLNVDHDHTTRKIRGLLCDHCNNGLGYFFDDSDLMLQAAIYMEAANAER